MKEGSGSTPEGVLEGLPGPEARRTARALTWTGVAVFWVVLIALSFGAGYALLDAILLAVLLAAVPAFAVAQVPLVAGVTIERLPAYWSSIATLWILGSACWFVGTRSGGPSAIGLVGMHPVSFAVWTLGLTAVGLGLIALFRALTVTLGLSDSDLLVQLLPRSRSERGVFALLSLAAGSGEELAYRGYAISALAPLVGVPGAAALSTAVFGVMHAYQGPLGIVRTACMGGVLAWGFLASGSLWPAITAHVLIDLVAGIVLGDRLIVRPDDPFGS